MRRTLATITVSGAVLAILAIHAPNASACSVPGIPGFKPVVTFPPALMPGGGLPATGPATTTASIVGLWHVKFFSAGALADDAFDVWHSDGTELLNDFTDPIEDNVCLGVWTQTGPQTYKLKHPSWTFDTGGNLTGVAYIFETITLGASGHDYTGTYKVSLFDTNANPVGSYEGTLKADRIMPD